MTVIMKFPTFRHTYISATCQSTPWSDQSRLAVNSKPKLRADVVGRGRDPARRTALQCLHVFTKTLVDLSVTFNEDTGRGTSAYGFKPHRANPGKDIRHPCLFHAVSETIKYDLPDTIGVRASVFCLRSLQESASKLPSDDAQRHSRILKSVPEWNARDRCRTRVTPRAAETLEIA